MDKLLKKIRRAAERRIRAGEDMKDVAFTLFRVGMEVMRDGTGESFMEAVVRCNGREPTISMSVEAIYPGHVARVVPEDTPDLGLMKRMIRETAELLDGYAQHHLAKSPPDIDKAIRNGRRAARLYDLLGVRYEMPPIPVENPQEAARSAQERDLLPGTGERPVKGSNAPLDRAELLAWFDMKLDGCAKHGMREASDVLQAMRGEVAQHLEAAPIDFAATLSAFYADCFARNQKAGWWTDLATGKPKKRSVGELFVLFVTELAEAYDAYLTGEPDDKLPHYPGLGVELGDLQIRLGDFCGALLAGNIVEDSGASNPGARMMGDICEIAREYEAIRKTPEAKGDEETGEYLPPADVGVMVVEKLAFNAQRADHKIENRVKKGGKQT